MGTTLFIYIFEILGIISYAISGSMIAIKNKLDLLGIVIIGFSTALAGGIMRDVFIGHIPPRIFSNYGFIILSFASSILVFIIYRLSIDNIVRKRKPLWIKLNFALDAIGLAVFSVIGVQIALHSQYSQNIFISVLAGFLSAVGGGVVRDILLGEIPFIFKCKEIYATAAIAGSIIYYILVQNNFNGEAASVISIATTIIMRFLAIRYKLSLPSINKTNPNT